MCTTMHVAIHKSRAKHVKCFQGVGVRIVVAESFFWLLCDESDPFLGVGGVFLMSGDSTAQNPAKALGPHHFAAQIVMKSWNITTLEYRKS